MICPNCGTQIPADERFCRNCGHEVEPLAATIIASSPSVRPSSNVTEQFNAQSGTTPNWPALPTNPTYTPPINTAQPTRSSLLIPITITSIVLALAAIGALAYFIATRSDGDEQASGKSEKTTTNTNTTKTDSTATPTPTAQPSPTTQTTATPTPTAAPTPKPTPNYEPPVGARLGYCNDSRVFLRSAPDLNARPITKLAQGQKLWVIGTSSNYSTWNGISSNWTQVQLYNSAVRGWVFTPFVSY